MPDQPLTILHLSDPHFGENGHFWNDAAEFPAMAQPRGDHPTLLNLLLRDLEALKTELSGIWPQVVVVSGDILDKAQTKAVPIAVKFLGDLADALGISREQVVLCPGNHDIDRKVASQYPKLALAPFAEVWNGFYPDSIPRLTLPSNPSEVCHVFSGPQGSLFLSLNSCEELGESPLWSGRNASATDRQRASEVLEQHGLSPDNLLARAIEQGYLSRDQLERAAKLLSEADGDGPRVAVVHHHLSQFEFQVDYSIMADIRRVLRWMPIHGISLVLHGHQHREGRDIRVLQGAEGTERFLTVLAGGSLGVGAYGRSMGSLKLTYQVVCIKGEQGVRHPRAFDPDPLGPQWEDYDRSRERRLLFGPVSIASTPESCPTQPEPTEPTSSPFHWRGRVDPEWFVGREQELSKSLEYLKAGQSVAVVSPPRGGRSSFLGALESRLRQSPWLIEPPMFLDLQSIALGGEAGMFRRMARLLGGEGDSYEDVDDLLVARESRPLFLLDEFEVLADKTHFRPALLGSWFSSVVGSGKLLMVVASSKPIRDLFPPLGSPLHGKLSHITLTPFSREQAERIWDRYLDRYGLDLNESQRDSLWEFSDGHPAKLMIATDRLFQTLKGQGDPSWKEASRKEWEDQKP